MKLITDDKQFMKDLMNIVGYSEGFLDGVQLGKSKFFKHVGAGVKEKLEEFIDSNARVNPQALHHVYEWYETGSPNARLFDIEYTVSNLGLSVKSSFTQSSSVKDGSTTPFYNKARIMEDGIPVTITPKRSGVLAFEDNGETVFTRNSVTVLDPGGQAVQGAYESAFDSFFRDYYSQSFLSSSGMGQYLKNPTMYKRNFAAGKRGGKSLGVETGMRWIMNAGALA
jgi:hypothetical protein